METTNSKQLSLNDPSKKNMSIELNTQLRSLVGTDMRKNFVEVLKSLPHRAISFSQFDDTDTIYGYYYNGEGNLIESEIKGAFLDVHDCIHLYMENSNISYSVADLLDDDKTLDFNWFILFSWELLDMFTMMNINEYLHEHLK